MIPTFILFSALPALSFAIVLPLEAHYTSVAPTVTQAFEARNTRPADFKPEDQGDDDCDEWEGGDPNQDDQTVVNAAAVDQTQGEEAVNSAAPDVDEQDDDECEEWDEGNDGPIGNDETVVNAAAMGQTQGDGSINVAVPRPPAQGGGDDNNRQGPPPHDVDVNTHGPPDPR